MKINVTNFFTGILSIILCIISLNSFAQNTEAGKVIAMRGFVTATDSLGNSRTLSRGDTLSSGDLIETGERSRLNILFSDGSTYLLRDRTTFKIDEYVDAGANNVRSKASFSIFRGALEAVSGWIGKGNSENYRMTTPFATIGLRGTTFQIEIINNPDGTTEVRASTLEGEIVYSSVSTDNGPSPIPPGLIPSDDLTGIEVEIDDTTGEVQSIVLTAGSSLRQPLEQALTRFAGQLFDSEIDNNGNGNDGGNDEDEDDDIEAGSPTN